MIEITEQDYKNILKKNKLPKKLLNQEITIVMPKAEAQKWLKALRSGRYKQAEGTLYDTEDKGFCCLGLQQKCAINKIEYLENPYSKDEPSLLKTIGWLNKENRVDSNGEVRQLPSTTYLRSRGIFYANFDGSRTDNPYIPSESEPAADLNDNGHTFKQLATFLEKHMAVY